MCKFNAGKQGIQNYRSMKKRRKHQQIYSGKKDELQKELKIQTANHAISSLLSAGEITRRMLKRKNIQSPDASNRIEIKKGLWIVPKEPFKSEKEKQEWIVEMQDKYN